MSLQRQDISLVGLLRSALTETWNLSTVLAYGCESFIGELETYAIRSVGQ